MTGVDYAGPFKMRYVNSHGEGTTRVKCWVAMFVCVKARVVNFEIAGGLASSAFLSCCKCFVGRRDRSYKMYGDNGTSFVGAEREIVRAFNQ